MKHYEIIEHIFTQVSKLADVDRVHLIKCINKSTNAHSDMSTAKRAVIILLSQQFPHSYNAEYLSMQYTTFVSHLKYAHRQLNKDNDMKYIIRSVNRSIQNRIYKIAA